MFETPTLSTTDKPTLYRELRAQARSIMVGERDRIANAANFAALVYHAVPQLNWCGFYFFDGAELVVGPFQGKPACVRIALGRGVCGTAAQRRAALIVPDVAAFPGHIACDAASRSELVVPLLRAPGGELLGVFDLDSPVPGRFDADDRDGIGGLARLWIHGSDLPAGL